jgi:hypothetical protein
MVDRARPKRATSKSLLDQIGVPQVVIVLCVKTRHTLESESCGLRQWPVRPAPAHIDWGWCAARPASPPAPARSASVISASSISCITARTISRSGVVTPAAACWMYGGALAGGMRKISYAGYRFPPEFVHQAIWLYLRFTLSFRDVEDFARGARDRRFVRDRAPLGETTSGL